MKLKKCLHKKCNKESIFLESLMNYKSFFFGRFFCINCNFYIRNSDITYYKKETVLKEPGLERCFHRLCKKPNLQFVIYMSFLSFFFGETNCKKCKTYVIKKDIKVVK